MLAPRFAFAPHGGPPPGPPEEVLFVDGTAAGFRSLSHWPGNSTPAALKHDLSTGIALNWAALDPARRRALCGDFSVVTNNHYDTDGALSALAMLRPEEALPRAGILLRAAATGDFATWNGPEALAVELTVTELVKHPASPLGAAALAAPDAERWERGYRWLLEALPAILDDPFRHRELWPGELERVLADVEAVQAGAQVEVERLPELDLAVVTTRRPLSAIGLHHAADGGAVDGGAAGPLYRVLLVRPGEDGFRYRFCYRDESWFETVTLRAQPRRPLEPLAAELQAREARRAPTWWHDPLDAPVCELGFGAPGGSAGFHGEHDLSADPPSRLEPAEVLEVLAAGLA